MNTGSQALVSFVLEKELALESFSLVAEEVCYHERQFLKDLNAYSIPDI